MTKQSKAAFWNGSDQSYEIISRSHEERGKEIIDLKARITELESFRNSANETLANAFSESREHEKKIATLREAFERIRDRADKGLKVRGKKSMNDILYYIKTEAVVTLVKTEEEQ